MKVRQPLMNAPHADATSSNHTPKESTLPVVRAKTISTKSGLFIQVAANDNFRVPDNLRLGLSMTTSAFPGANYANCRSQLLLDTKGRRSWR